MKLLSYDLETTGLDETYCQVLQIGAVVFDPEIESVIWTFNTLIKHERIVGEPYALQLNASLLKRIAEGEGVPEKEAWGKFKFFQNAFFGEEKPHVVGFNVGSFDLRFTPKEIRNGFHHRSIELGSYMLKSDFTPMSSTEAAKQFLDRDVTHDALQDALDVVKIFRQNIRK